MMYTWEVNASLPSSSKTVHTARGTLGDTKKARVPYPLAFPRDNMQKSNCSTCKRSILLRSHTCLTTGHGMALPLCQIGQERKLSSSLPSVH
uniref:Uncharacterized protein n=1 Tax=Ixodes ricinus TaxID=34613 RepID=A0A0K8RFP8_IXORI